MKQLSIITILVFTIIISSFAMQKKADSSPDLNFENYEASWSNVQEFENQGKPKSALEEVELIILQARKESNSPQLVKGLLHKFKYQMVLEEDSELKVVNSIKEELINSNDEIAKAILNSILAESYWQYYQQNRYRFLNRTETATIDQTDFRTWDLKNLLSEVKKHFLASIEKESLLQSAKISAFDAIIYNQNETEEYRPTIYDLLAHRAIDYFTNAESGVTESVNAFSMDDAKYFSKASSFNELKFPDSDDAFEKEVLLIFQELLAFRLKDNNIPAFVDADLKRYQFVRNNSNLENKDALYIEALQALSKQYTANDISAYVNYQIAQFWYNNSNADEEKGDIRIKAVELCNTTIEKYPNAFGSTNCKSLLQQIEAKNIGLQMEGIVAPDQVFKALVNYRNIDKAYFKVVQLSDDELGDSYNYNDREKWIKKMANRTATKEWSQVLPNPKDYYDHSAEVKMEALPTGAYVMLLSYEADFKNNVDVVKEFWSSSISYVTKQTNDNALQLYVLDRSNGFPLANAKVDVYYDEYNYNERKNQQIKLSSLTSDANGLVTVDYPGRNRNQIYFDISYKKDRLKGIERHYVHQYRESEPKWRVATHFFLDRAIYRPGQTIYFKGILLQTNGEESKLSTNTSTTVTLRDVNYQEVAVLNLRTNDFGSFNGSFTAPSGGLMGRMQLVGAGGQTYFRVEEYKRPTFEVIVDTLKGSYSLNQEVTLTGKGMSYAGAPLIDAKVRYRVVREVRYPYWYWGWGRPAYTSTAKEITNGETETAKDGSYSINFETIPDQSVDKKSQPQFQYTVYVDIVDISGETRSAQKSITAGYVGLNLEVNVPENWNRDQLQTINVSTTNLDGREEAAEVELKIYQLMPPQNLKKARLWGIPDQFVMTEAQHQDLFPNELYKEESNIANWEKKLVKTYTINTGKQKSVEVKSETINNSGIYLVEATTKDKASNVIEAKSNFTAVSKNDMKLANPEHLSVKVDKNIYQPGETAKVSIGSSLKEAFVIYELSYDGKIIDKKYLKLNNEIVKISVPVNASQRGGIQVQAILVQNNRAYKNSSTINVPFEEKSLDVEWITFRDLLEPGQKEQWKLKIKGPKGDQVASELLATMYDKSLDYFVPHQFNFPVNLNPYIKTAPAFGEGRLFQALSSQAWLNNNSYNYSITSPTYPGLNLFGFYLSNYGHRYLESVVVSSSRYSRSQSKATGNAAPQALMAMDEMAVEEESFGFADAVGMAKKEDSIEGGSQANQPKENSSSFSPRKNLNETAFFFPQLETNAEGDVLINFTMPEALTTWKFLGFAHDKELHHQIFTKEVKTQKDLMVTPNFPRYFREGDKITITAKIDNLSDKQLSGNATLVLKDALTNKVIDSELLLSNGNQTFTIDEKGSKSVEWKLSIPKSLQAVTYEVIAKAGDFTDGVTSTLPVLTNRMMVTESLPLWLKGKGTKQFTFKNLKNNESKTLENYQVTLEYASNPIWYAVQALPYLMEFPHECTEQLFSRYYSNSIAGHVVNTNPTIKDVFEQWKTTHPEALMSNLEKNQELKSLLIEETPWLRNAQDEGERKKRIALLFDLNRMQNEKASALQKIQERQTPNGGFSWFPGMRDSRYITQHILSGIAHLVQLNIEGANDPIINSIVEKAIPYLDARIVEDFDNIKKYSKNWKKEDHLNSIQIHYLYVRAHFKSIPMSGKAEEAFNYFLAQAESYWLNKGFYNQGMMAIALHAYEKQTTAKNIMASIKENSIVSEEMGMYWKAIEQGGYYWYNAPIESQALLIEAFHTVTNDNDAVNEMKVWLLKQKQVQDWRTTKATTEAIFALLLRGEDWLKSTELAQIKVGGKLVEPKKMDATIEPGTGYFKVKWNGEQVSKDMADVTVTSTTDAPSWGAMYWQYFEDLDQIKTFEDTPLQLKKDIFVETNSNSGPVITPIKDVKSIQPGDKLKIRIELRVDRNMEFVHMKDMRASGLEPINVLSQYKYQDGLGYYESTKDAATHFFFDYLPKGVYVFEYPLRVAHKGDFSNGITTIQSMYAPEFASHSQGVRVEVK
ncbi:MAG: MG2 domain-containing protein [Chitinophagales bacterium]